MLSFRIARYCEVVPIQSVRHNPTGVDPETTLGTPYVTLSHCYNRLWSVYKPQNNTSFASVYLFCGIWLLCSESSFINSTYLSYLTCCSTAEVRLLFKADLGSKATRTIEDLAEEWLQLDEVLLIYLYC